MTLPLLAMLVLLPAALAYAAASDLVSMTISNRLCLAIAGGFFVTAPLAGLGAMDIGMHLAAGGLMLVVCFGLFAAGWVGGGDAKLVAATALWFGFGHLLAYLTLSAMLGGILTLLMVQFRTVPLPARVEGWDWAKRLHAADKGVPYGIALGSAALMLLPQTAIWRASAGL